MEKLTEQILEKLKNMEKRLESIEKYLELIYQEREILEDLRISQAALKEQVSGHREHIDNIVSDVKSDISIQGVKTERKLEEARKTIEHADKKVEEIKKAIT